MKKSRKSAWAVATGTILLAASSAHSAVININDLSLVPDGTTASAYQHTNVGNVLPATTPSTIYFVTTFTFGTDSQAGLWAQFAANSNNTGADRLGVRANPSGLVEIIGTGAPLPSVNLGSLAGQTITLLGKLDYNADHSVTYSQANVANDTIMNLWINPTASTSEGSGLTAGDLNTIWNSAGFSWFRQTINNQSTPITAGTSFIEDTVILTGSDATFANALAIAIPEPTTALLGGLGLLALLRRRRG